MGEYLAEENENNPSWKQLAEALEVCTADVGISSKQEWEQNGCFLIKEIAKQYGAINTVNCIRETIKGDCSWELYWLARASIKEVQSILVELLNSNNEDELTSAVCGLLHFDNELAWNTLKKLIKGEHKVKLSESASFYFLEDLGLINNEKSNELIKLIKTNT